MTENEFRAHVWQCSIKRVLAMIEEYSEGWLENGPSKAAAAAIVKKIRAMPVPGPTQRPEVTP
jgi:hypothetical protein